MENGDFVNFRAVFDQLTDEVMRARYQFISDHLCNWFRAIDDTPSISVIVKQLESGLNIHDWWTEYAWPKEMGGGKLKWPEDPEKELGMKLLLFRAFSEARPDRDIGAFGYQHIHVGTNINDNARAVIDQLFRPMARELRRYLERKVAEVPASDRVVRIDDNSKAYRDVVDALEKLEETLRCANDYSDVLEKDQRVAEVSASLRLLKAAQVRVEALVALLRPVVVQFTTKVKDNLISAAAAKVSTAIVAWLGHFF
jgi:hypothetical protein